MTRLTSIGTDAWHVQGAPLRMPLGVKLPIASSVLRLPDGSLVLYSPVALDDELAAELAALGQVAHVVAPSVLHHKYAAAALARYPDAKLHAPPGLARKRPDLRIDHVLGASARSGSAEPAWRDAIEPCYIAGAPKLDEVVLFHRASGTLACADLFFNLPKQTGISRFAFGLTGVGGGHPAQSRVWTFLVKDRAATRASIDQVLCMPVQQIAPAHGRAFSISAADLSSLVERAYGGRPQPVLAAATT